MATLPLLQPQSSAQLYDTSLHPKVLSNVREQHGNIEGEGEGEGDGAAVVREVVALVGEIVGKSWIVVQACCHKGHSDVLHAAIRGT